LTSDCVRTVIIISFEHGFKNTAYNDVSQKVLRNVTEHQNKTNILLLIIKHQDKKWPKSLEPIFALGQIWFGAETSRLHKNILFLSQNIHSKNTISHKNDVCRIRTN
jgi:hypothetical protein